MLLDGPYKSGVTLTQNEDSSYTIETTNGDPWATAGLFKEDVPDAFCLPRHRVVHVAVQNFMQLQNVVPRNWNGIKIFVDDIQRITVSGNFLLISVSGRSFFFDQLADSSLLQVESWL